MVVGTPAGVTLAPEGGAHQSIYTPLIGMSQPGLTYFEPAYVDELAEIMRWGFDHMQQPDGGSVYLRLSTRAIAQATRRDDRWKDDLLEGAYWQVEPDEGAEIAIAYAGAIVPEALAAFEALREDAPGAGLLAVPAAGRLHDGWMAALNAQQVRGERQSSHVERLLGRLSPTAGLVTVIDGSPQALTWLGSVLGHRVVPLGLTTFGQSGDIPALHRISRLDADAILDAAATALIQPRT